MAELQVFFDPEAEFPEFETVSVKGRCLVLSADDQMFGKTGTVRPLTIEDVDGNSIYLYYSEF